MNNYHIYEEVGRGKFSVVYKGRVKKSIKYVAVKSVERSRRRKLMNEVRIFHDLQHKNVLKFYHWYETRNHLWIIFEYCAGGDLDQLIEKDKRLPEETVRKFGFELVEGLSYLHSNGIIYADLKPSNILLNEYGALKYADFGLSKKLSDFSGTQEAQATGSANEAGRPKTGTPFYMAPELFHDSGVHSFYSDFWALGCVLYEMAMGKPPFGSDSLKDLITMIVEREAPLPVQDPSYSEDFNDLLRRLLEKDPIKRINWDEIKGHSFWKLGNGALDFTKRTYPQQQQFDAYLRARGIVPEHFYDQRNNSFAKKLAGPASLQNSGGNKIDILRLSYNVRRNIKREQQDEDESQTNNGIGVPAPSSSNGGQYGASAQAAHNLHSLGKQFSGSSGMLLQPGGKHSDQSASALAMQGGNQQMITPAVVQQVQTTEDDVSLNNNRRAVLNFGERSEEDDTPMDPRQLGVAQQQPSSYLSTGPQTNLNPGGLLDIEVNLNRDKPLNPSRRQEPPQNTAPIKFYPTAQPENSKTEEDYQSTPTSNVLFDKISMPVQPPGGKKASQTVRHNQSNNILAAQQQPLFTKTQAPPQHIGTLASTKQYPQSQKDLMLLINQQVFNQPVVIPTLQQTTQFKTTDTQQTQRPPQYKSIDQLLMHNSDTAVKPIIGNKEIERSQSNENLVYDHTALIFKPWAPDQIVQNIDTPQIEQHLNDLYNAIQSQQSSINEKINSLLYFESIIVNSSVSNRLINSAFMALIVRMLKSIKTPQIRERICSVIGLLIRHSTVIENEVAESDVSTQLVDVLLRDKQPKVRRKAVAALGEYMFYAATQLDDEQSDPCWEIKDDAINAIIKSIKVVDNPEMPPDETVIFYAVKTLENITAQSNSAGGRFATQESANYLLQIFLGIYTQDAQRIPLYQNENLRTSAAVALSHICRLQPKLFPLVFNKITPKVFCYTLCEGQARVQQAFITLLNQALSQGNYPKINDILLRLDSGTQEDGSRSQPVQTGTFLKSLIKLLEHHSIVIRGKTILTFLLLFKQDFRWMAIVEPEIKLFHLLDRLARENYKYVQCCLTCLIEGIFDIIPLIFSAVSEELNQLLNDQARQVMVTEFDQRIRREEFEQLQLGGNNMIYIVIVLDLLQAQCVKQRLVNPAFIKSIATLIDNTSTFQGSDEFLNALLLIVENISSTQKLLIQHVEPIINILLPELLQKTTTSTSSDSEGGEQLSQSADLRFLSLKTFTDIVIQFLNDEAVYNVVSGDQEMIGGGGGVSRQLNELLLQTLFPQLIHLLQEPEPMPLFAIKLLSALLERNTPLFSKALLRSNTSLLRFILDQYYQPGTPRFNRHTVNIVKCIVQSRELSYYELQQTYKVGVKTQQLLEQALLQQSDNNKDGAIGDQCTEILLDVLQVMLSSLIEAVQKKQEGKEISLLIDDVLSSFDLCVQLLNPTGNNGSPTNNLFGVVGSRGASSSELSTALVERASQCLILMLQLYALCSNPQSAPRKREIYFNESHLSYLLTALKIMSPSVMISNGSQSANLAEKKLIVKRVLKCIYWAFIQSEYKIKLKADKRAQLEHLITQLITHSDDKSIQNTSREIQKIFFTEQTLGNTPMSSGASSTADSGFNSSQQQQQMQMIEGGSGRQYPSQQQLYTAYK